MKLYIFIDEQEKVVASVRASSYQDAISKTGYQYKRFDVIVEEVEQ